MWFLCHFLWFFMKKEVAVKKFCKIFSKSTFHFERSALVNNCTYFMTRLAPRNSRFFLGPSSSYFYSDGNSTLCMMGMVIHCAWIYQNFKNFFFVVIFTFLRGKHMIHTHVFIAFFNTFTHVFLHFWQHFVSKMMVNIMKIKGNFYKICTNCY